jgi:Protein kinase domain
MSIVYRAQNLRLGNQVALKILAPELAEDDAFRERFVRESRTAASISHPNIIPIYDAGEHEELLYIAMRYVDGADLKEIVRRDGALAPARALGIFAQVASALDTAHSHHLIHRDIKPANILIERLGLAGDVTDHAYLADFGLTKHLESSSGLTHTGQFVGTIDYIPPEQIHGGKLDERSDLYSLGCVVFQCLTGSVPFQREGDAAVLFAHISDTPPSASAARPDLPPGVDAVIARALAKSPDERYQTARDMISDLRKQFEQEGESVHGVQRTVAGEAGGSTLAPLEAAALAGATVAAGERRATMDDGEDPVAPPPQGGPGEPTREPPRRLGGWGRGPLIAVAVVALLAAGGIGAAVGTALSGSDSPSTAASGHHGTTTGGGAVDPKCLKSSSGPLPLACVMPTNLYKNCSPAPKTGQLMQVSDALETVSCQQPPVTYQVSEYKDTASVVAAFRNLVSPLGLEQTRQSCHAQHVGWSGEADWKHVAAVAGGPRHLGGHRACYARPVPNSTSSNWFIIWTHERKNEANAPPQCDHRDVLVVAEQRNTGVATNLQAFFHTYQKPIGFLGGAATTKAATEIYNAHCSSA